jgi:hypothetical protein
VCTVVAALILTGVAHAGYPVQPNGTTVAGQPTFLVYRDNGETIPIVEVARTPDMSTRVGSCSPYTPFGGEPHKFTCRIPWDLAPGTYYWTFSYWKDDNCVTYSFGTYCYPQEHKSAPLPFTIATPQPPAGAGLVSPLNGRTVGLPLTLVLSAPASSSNHRATRRQRLDLRPVELHRPRRKRRRGRRIARVARRRWSIGANGHRRPDAACG